MRYDFDLLDKMLNGPPRDQIFSLFEEFKSELEEAQKIKKKFDFERNLDFNIFTSISETYKKTCIAIF